MPAARSETATEKDKAPLKLSRRRGRGLRAFGMLILLGMAALFGGFLAFVHGVARTEQKPAQKADGIVVLTGSALRISDALDLLASGHGRRLLITGVNPATRAAEISRLMPARGQLFACCVDIDRAALNTIGNAVETRRWTGERGFKSLIVVTSNFHMPRSLLEIAHHAPGVSLVPFPVVSDRVRIDEWWSSPATARLLVFEYLKYIVALARTRIERMIA